MALDWSRISAEHVTRACNLIADGEIKSTAKDKGLLVVFRNQRLAAKQVLRVAYCLANQLPLEANVKFASGEGTLRRLQELGASVERVPPVSKTV